MLQPGDHGATFGGGPLVAAAALATLDVLDDDRLQARVRVLGDRLRVGLEALREQGRLTDVRGRGLMVGADLPSPTGCRRGRRRARGRLRAERDRPVDAAVPAAADRGRARDRPRARIPGGDDLTDPLPQPIASYEADPEQRRARPAPVLGRPRHLRDAEVDPGPLRRRDRGADRRPRPARRGLRRRARQGAATGRARLPGGGREGGVRARLRAAGDQGERRCMAAGTRSSRRSAVR